MKADGPRLTRRAAMGVSGAIIALSASSGTSALAQSKTRSSAPAGTDSGGFNVKDFGAAGDAVLAADGSIGSGTDDTAAIQAALNYIDSIGGGTLYFPEGNYCVTSYLRLCRNLRVVGAGRQSSCIVTYATGGAGANPADDLRNGSVFFSYWDNGPPITSNPVNITIEHIGFTCWNPANVGAAFYDSNGTNIQLKHCSFNGFKHGVVLDYSELVDIEYCDFEYQGRAGLWIVNGPTLNAGHAPCVTNRISVNRSQINQESNTYGILDEGGYSHSYIDNNYNGCLNHLYAAGVQALQVVGGEFEASAAQSIEITYVRATDGVGVGGCTGHFLGMMNSTVSQPCINITSVSGPISIRACVFIRGDSGIPITGANNAGAGLLLSGNYSNSASGEMVDGCNAGYLSDDRVELPIRTNSALSTLSLICSYAGKLVECINPVANVCTIKSDSAGVLPMGIAFHLEQSAAGPVSLAADPGVNIIGPTATTAQHQRLVLRKRGRNSWISQLMVPNPMTQAITPVSIAATGPIVSSGGGIGYAASASGKVVQANSKSTSVTLNKLSGEITLSSMSLAPATTASFTLVNGLIAAGDLLILNHVSGGTPGSYQLNAHGAAAGSVVIDVTNIGTAPLSEAIVVGFAIIKGGA